jgi:ribose transport system substrate-binding protein
VKKSVATASVLLAAFSVLVSGCGSSDKGGGSSGSGDSAQAAKASENVKALEKPPTELTGPYAGGKTVTAAKGKTLGVLSFGLAAPDQARAAKSLEKAAGLLGWKVTVVDGKLSPQGWATGMEQLVSQKPDAIVTLVIPDGAIPAALKKANDAGIFVACALCAAKYTKPIETPSDVNAGVDPQKQGQAAADYITAHSGAKAKIGMLNYSPSAVTINRTIGAKDRWKSDCSGCDVVKEAELGGATDLVAAGGRAAQSMLSQFPKGQLDYIVSASDDFNAGVYQAIQVAGRAGDVKVVSYDCNEQGLAEIRKGGVEVACVDTALEFNAWAALNLVIQHMAGNEMKEEEVPFTLVDKGNAPPEGDLPATYDYESYFKKLWNLS